MLETYLDNVQTWFGEEFTNALRKAIDNALAEEYDLGYNRGYIEGTYGPEL